MILTGGRLYAPGSPGATALAIRNGMIIFVGDDDGARRAGAEAPEITLAGRLVTPAFVDAHLHAIQTGQVMAGLDLHEVPSRHVLLDRLAAYEAAHDVTVIVGQGWDERSWPDPRPPTRAELDRVAPGRAVYLARVDVHSAVVSSRTIDRAPGISDQAGFRDDGLLSREAHHVVRGLVNGLFSDADRRAAARRSLQAATTHGVATVHELGGPHLGPIEDLTRVRAAGADLGLEVITYWGELATPESIARARAAGVNGLAGDLCIDGSLGSRTAALTEPYADAPLPGGCPAGARYLSDAEITDHIVACTQAGLQAGFHCIGDDAVAAAVDGFRRAAQTLGPAAIRTARHRLEHLEMVAAGDLATLAELGVVASVQPAFDALWGGSGELYEQRLGAVRASTMNPFRSVHRAGVVLAFGTDAPVTPLAGWAMVRDARRHSRPEEQLSTEDAFAAATEGGHRAAGLDGAGVLAAGVRATLAIWDLADGPADRNVLPALQVGDPLPTCAGTLANGRFVYRSEALAVGG
jgi:predicted amidohydrolase YtcJ